MVQEIFERYEKSMVFLQMMKKYSGVVYKRRVKMDIASAVQYLNNGILPESENQIFREIQYMKQRYHLEPAAYVAYDRLACYCKTDEELRVTFDWNIRCRNEALDLRAGAYGTSLLDAGCVLMEVKIPGASAERGRGGTRIQTKHYKRRACLCLTVF